MQHAFWASVPTRRRNDGEEEARSYTTANLLGGSEDELVLATGTGVIPLYPILEQYAREGSGEAHLVLGERDREHLIFRESLDRLQIEHGSVVVDYRTSR